MTFQHCNIFVTHTDNSIELFYPTENVNVRQKWKIRAGLQFTVEQRKSKEINGKTTPEMERDSET